MGSPTYFYRTYDETLVLMEEARLYMGCSERGDRLRAGGARGTRVCCEALRVTSRLTQVLAWLMNQRAVHDGEISQEQALSEERRLSAADVCLDESHHRDSFLPGSLRSLMDRSHRLYVRVARLEEMMIKRTLPN